MLNTVKCDVLDNIKEEIIMDKSVYCKLPYAPDVECKTVCLIYQVNAIDFRKATTHSSENKNNSDKELYVEQGRFPDCVQRILSIMSTQMHKPN
jgi:hypothetical protein